MCVSGNTYSYKRVLKLWVICIVGIAGIPATSRERPIEIRESLFQLKDAITNKTIFRIHSNAPKVIVFIGYLRGCPILRRLSPTLKNIKIKFGSDVAFVVLDPAPRPDRRATVSDVKKFMPGFPLVSDRHQVLLKHLEISIASEVAVVESASGKIIYRGAVDDSLSFDYQRAKAEKNYLIDVLDKATIGQVVSFSYNQPYGCNLNRSI